MSDLNKNENFSNRIGIKQDILTTGFARGTAEDFNLTCERKAGFSALCLDADAAPLDPAISPAKFRRRLFGGFLRVPGVDRLIVMPTTKDDDDFYVREYLQPIAYNSDAGGVSRKFRAAGLHTHENLFLLDLVEWMFQNSPLTSQDFHYPIQINFHIVVQQATGIQPSTVSPPYVHCDGEAVTWAVLLERNASGGESFVTERSQIGKMISDVKPEDILSRFTLEKPLDWYVVHDIRVAHHVEPITATLGHTIATRSMLLVDFTPMRPMLAALPNLNDAEKQSFLG